MNDETDTGLVTARLARLRRELAEMQSLTFWRPEPGDTLAGTLVGLRPAVGPYGVGHHLVVKAEDGTTTLWLTGYLKAQLEAFHAEPGDLVAIRYDGRGTSARGTQYNRYEVLVEKAGVRSDG
jgi:hypothetical protein